MSCCGQLSMAKSRVAHGDTLHELAQWLIVHLHERMQVVRHPTERVQACKAEAETFCDDVVEHVTIAGCRE